MKIGWGGVEQYRLNWPGKRQALATANRSTTYTLRPARSKSKNFDNTKNIVIEGDNLIAMKLLQRSYLAKVKLIYIDPPYNTGKDFIYRDNFHQTAEDYHLKTEQVSETGHKLVANLESNGRFHSDWLSMMYSRLKVAHSLLRDDGVIFISIDNGEVHNLRKMCDEIFGEPNFVADIIWEKKFAPANDAKWFSDTHDYILVYARNKLKWFPQLLPRTEKHNARYKNPDSDPRGVWLGGDLSVKTFTEKYYYKITTPSGREVYPPPGRCWTCSEESFKEMISENRIWFGENGDRVPTVKRFLKDVKDGITPVTIWTHEEVGHNSTGRRELKKLFDDQGLFDNPKPVSLIERIIHVANVQHGDVVLDFFAGSGTTAQAVMKYSAVKSIGVNFILVQLDVQTSQDSQAYKAGYSRISDVTLDRVRRSATKLEEEIKKFSFQDYGFRVFQVDTSNMEDTFYTPENTTQELLPKLVETVKPDRTDNEDILFQIICDEGIELTLPILKRDHGGAEIYVVGSIKLVACLDGEITTELLDEIVQMKPDRIVIRQSLFQNDAEMTNSVEYLRQKYSVDTLSML